MPTSPKKYIPFRLSDQNFVVRVIKAMMIKRAYRRQGKQEFGKKLRLQITEEETS
jgi:hypothetical protein